MKKYNTQRTLVAILATLVISTSTQAQTYNTGAIANFGIDGDIKSDAQELIELKPDRHTVVPWTATKPKAEEDITDLCNEDTQLIDDSTTVEKVSLAKTDDSMKAEAELRRLELRKRMESTKAKDSREAADRALKKLFGG